MQDDDSVMTMRRSQADLEERLRKAVGLHAERHGIAPAQVVDEVERFLQEPPGSSDLRLDEMRHRVKNEMQLLISAMRQRDAGNARERGSCAACIGQVAALAQLNTEMDEDSGACEIDLGQQAQRFASAMRSAFGLDTEAGRLDILTEQLFVSRKVARNVLLIMNEAATNAVKHGIGKDGGTIRIFLSAVSHDVAELTVENETSDQHTSREGGNGRSLIDALAAGIGGHVVRRANKDGFSLTCSFPARRAHPGRLDRSRAVGRG